MELCFIMVSILIIYIYTLIYNNIHVRFCHQLRLTARWALILLLGAVRCVQTLTEQPGSSIMRHYAYIKYLKKMIADVLGGTWNETYLSKPQVVSIQIETSCYNF